MKTIGDVERGIPTQAIDENSITKILYRGIENIHEQKTNLKEYYSKIPPPKSETYLQLIDFRIFHRLTSNICLKINAKLGGKNFKLSKDNQ